MGRAILFLLVVALFSHSVMAAAPSCGQVSSAIAPCTTYLTDLAQNPSQACCGGVKQIKDMGPTQTDRQAICLCLKRQAALLPSLDQSRASGLPKLCNVQVETPITPDVDCSKVQ